MSLVLLCVCNMAANTCFSLLAPFFPAEVSSMRMCQGAKEGGGKRELERGGEREREGGGGGGREKEGGGRETDRQTDKLTD